MRLVVQSGLLRVLVALPLLACPAAARASGFAVESQGARAMGFSGAYVAQAADPSAIYYNAAGIAFLKGKQILVAGALGGLSTDFTGEGPFPAAGTLETTDNGLALLPAVYYTQQVGQGAVIGLGVSRAFAARSKWADLDNFTGRYICLECRIGSWSINPTIAYKLADRLSVGGGVDVRLSKFELSRRLMADPNPFDVPTDVAELTLESGMETGVGFNFGLLASPSESFSIGVAYRHEVTIDHVAQADFVQILTGNKEVDDAVKLALPASQPVTASFTYPASIAVGAALRRRYWTVEADVQWMLWSSFDAVTLAFANSPAFDTTLPQAYASTWRGAIGAEYLIGDQWEVRGGYSYDRSPQPTDTISPFLHDEDRHGFALGGSYKYETLRVDVAARYLLYSNRSTQGLSRYGYNGLYQSDGFSLAVSFAYQF